MFWIENSELYTVFTINNSRFLNEKNEDHHEAILWRGPI